MTNTTTRIAELTEAIESAQATVAKAEALGQGGERITELMREAITGWQRELAAEQLRAQAAQHHQDAADSFERCDTDGFVSQWASDQMGMLRRREADLAEHGNTWTFERVRLERLDGTPVEDARVVETKYGTKWRSDSEDAWLPYMPAREATLAKRGYREVTETEVAPAKAIHWSPSNARGLSGATSVQVIVFRTDRPKSEGWRPVGAPEA